MIYIHPNDKLHTPQRQSVFNFNLYLCGETPILRNSLLVTIITIKKEKVLCI